MLRVASGTLMLCTHLKSILPEKLKTPSLSVILLMEVLVTLMFGRKSNKFMRGDQRNQAVEVMDANGLKRTQEN